MKVLESMCFRFLFLFLILAWLIPGGITVTTGTPFRQTVFTAVEHRENDFNGDAKDHTAVTSSDCPSRISCVLQCMETDHCVEAAWRDTDRSCKININEEGNTMFQVNGGWTVYMDEGDEGNQRAILRT